VNIFVPGALSEDRILKSVRFVRITGTVLLSAAVLKTGWILLFPTEKTMETPAPPAVSSSYQKSSGSLNLSVLSSRNPFQAEESPGAQVRAPAPPALPPAAVPPPVPVIHLAERASNLVLNGIVQSVPPQAVMFDRRTQKTHYLSAGDALGEIRVLEISGSRVILGWETETLEMAL
jgi:hypothetical protein